MQRNNIYHATDEELLRAADGEFSSRKVSRVRGHVAACSICRARLDRLLQTADDFAQSFRHEYTVIPPDDDARTKLGAALQRREMESARLWRVTGPMSAMNPLAGWNWAYASVVVLFACFAVYFSPHFHRSRLATAPDTDSDRSLPVPLSNLTPGVARPISASQACIAGPVDQMSSIPLAVRQTVLHEYGVNDPQGKQYEVDHLITPELGGTDDIRNLWAEPYSSEWNAGVKDQLEDHLRDLVCEGKLDVRTAQRDIATDWISAYKKYFQTDKPLSSSRS